jgi:hypothetical protein
MEVTTVNRLASARRSHPKNTSWFTWKARTALGGRGRRSVTRLPHWAYWSSFAGRRSSVATLAGFSTVAVGPSEAVVFTLGFPVEGRF